MHRYIDADELIHDIKHCLWDWDSVDDITASLVLKQTITDIENQPTAHVAPVIHAHWINAGQIRNECSNCHDVQGGIYSKTPFCPYCGAKMDEVINDA